jgi:hypothetical protein
MTVLRRQPTIGAPPYPRLATPRPFRLHFCPGSLRTGSRGCARCGCIWWRSCS